MMRAAQRAADPVLTPAEAALVSIAGRRSFAAAQAGSLTEIGHRPWPLPDEPWVQGQTWCDLLFAHWALPVGSLRGVVSPELPIDTWDGQAWIGVTPFEVRGLRLRGVPPLPGLSAFPETNVRTYVTVDGKPGIHFLSLDAASRFAVAAARLTYRLPYFHARMSIQRTGDQVAYRTQRANGTAALAVDYRPDGPVHLAVPGSLEHFLTERYCLYTVPDGRLHRADIHHRPWPLQPARADVARNTMTAPRGIQLPDHAPLLHFARRQDVVIWAPRLIA
jgi:uncharacterized protein YqjF (DUF2071 family)